MTIIQFENIVRAYVTRQASSLLTSDSQNITRQAANNAKIFAQRSIDFNWLRDAVYLDCNPSGNYLTGLKLESSGAATKVKKLTKAYQLTTDGQAKIPIKYISRDAFARDVEKRVDLLQIPTDQNPRWGTTANTYAVHFGQNVELYPRPTGTYRIYFDGILWLADYSADGDTDFMLDYCRDFLLYRTLIELNYYIKEDERFEISETLMSEAWDAMTKWNDSLISPTDSELDL